MKDKEPRPDLLRHERSRAILLIALPSWLTRMRKIKGTILFLLCSIIALTPAAALQREHAKADWRREDPTFIDPQDSRLNSKKIVKGAELRDLLVNRRTAPVGWYIQREGVWETFSSKRSSWTTLQRVGEVWPTIFGTWKLQGDGYFVDAPIYPQGRYSKVYRMPDGTFLIKHQIIGGETYVVRVRLSRS